MEIKKNIQSFILKNNLVYCNNKSELFLAGVKVEDGIDSQSYEYIDNNIWYHDENGETFMYSNGVIKKISEKSIYFYTITNDKAIFSDNFIIKKDLFFLDYYIVDLKTHNSNFIFRGNASFKEIIYDNVLLYSEHKKEFILLNYENRNIIWQYSIAHFPNYVNGFGDEVPADIEQIIGIYNNLLWVILGAKTLIALNIKTGTLEHTFEKFKKGMGDIHLDEQKGVLKILAGFSYEEFDLKTLTTTEKYRDKNEKLFIRSCNFYPGDDNLYFCAVNNWPDNTSFNAFGVFNTIQNKVIWLQEQQDDWGLFYNPPQANQKQLAILDDKGNLLIFEKEDIIGKASLSNI